MASTDTWIDFTVQKPEGEGPYLVELSDGVVTVAYWTEASVAGTEIGKIWVDEYAVVLDEVAFWCEIPPRVERVANEL